MKKYLAEFIGTFFLVGTVGAAVRSGAPLGPLAIGSALMGMVYACGHISGGHLNPAVTLGVWLRGKCETKDVIPYWIAQLIAAVIAALIVNYVAGTPPGAAPLRGTVTSIIVEFLVTFALVWVVLNVATAKATAGNSYFGLAIGFTVFMGAVSVGGVSGGAFNPAVGLGVFVMKLENLHQLAVYVVADLLGGAAAALAFKATHTKDE